MNDMNSLSHIGQKGKCHRALEIRRGNGIPMRYGGEVTEEKQVLSTALYAF